MTAGTQLTFFKTEDGRTVEVKPRGKHYVEPRGYAHFPGTGPQGEKCKTCRFYTRRHGKYRKCDHPDARRRWTGGPGSDILANSPACSKWQKPDGD